MATSTANPIPSAASSIDTDQFLEQQLAKTRFQVRVVDLASSLMALVAATLVYVLVLALVDHWVMPLAWWSRWLSCIALLGGVGYYVAAVVVPLMMRPINPVYAARAIEDAEPTLKNSLINFLMFKNDHGSLHQVIFAAMQQRAAADLHRVPIDGAVDRSKVIHFGYLLAGVLAVCAAYTILSPKDPLQSAARVIAPWAAIERPTRVKINDVQPGDTTVYQGDSVTVSCSLEGRADAVTMYFSTTDGEIDEQPVEMKLAANGLRFECKLPPDKHGLQQSVTYRIEAGDAVTPTYRIEVSPAPHITVERLEYEFPAYTKRSRQTDEGRGDIKALEGTRVTIHAKANQPIQSASIELSDSRGETARLAMQFHEREAWRTITLELEADHKTANYSAYQLRFATVAGRESEDPILHRIEVLPDLPPEISILTPRQEVTEVPQDGSQTIEVRAIDPDFGLTSVQLHFVMGGTELLDKALLTDRAGVAGQSVHNYEFRPHLLGLQPGDRVVYRAIAEDNRTAVGSDSPNPNRARTKDYQLLIIPPSKTAANPNGDKDAEKSRDSDPQRDATKDPESGDTTGDDQSKSGGPESSDDAQGGGKEQQEGLSGAAEQGGAKEEEKQGSGGSEAASQDGQDGASGGQPQPGQSGGGEQAGGNSAQESGGAGGEQGSGEPQGPSEPLHDGEVFEKALERMKQQAQDAGQRGQGQSSDGDPQGNADEQGDGSKTNGASQEGSSGEKQPDGGGKDSSKQSTDPKSPDDGSHSDGQTSGAGTQQQDAPGEGDTSEKPDRPTEKNGTQSGDRGKPQDETATGLARDKKQSDSQGESNGERSGGGTKGPGQGANQAGNDTAGQNSTAEEGAGAANDAGQGESSSAAGNKQHGEGETGSTGSEQGSGSSSRGNPSGDKAGSGAQPPSTEKQQEAPSDNNPASSSGGPAQGRDGLATGGGLPSDNEATSSIDKQLDVPPGDEANLEYTRRATDMVLEYLKDQQDNPDPKLLQELGWTEAELAAFLQRWQQLKQSAAEDSASKRDLDESLRSLGLRPARDRVRQGTTQSDGATGLRDSGTRTAPPPGYQELFDAFKKGAARSLR